MKFEFDQNKSAANKEKHGIDFIEAQAIWLNKTLRVPSKYPSEQRHLEIGMIGNVFWTAVVTFRFDENGEQIIRPISVRRSREDEKERFKSSKNNG